MLRDLSLDVAPGARIAVTGPSGSGKTTLAALLVRYLDPSRGRVDLGGTPVAWLRLDDLRSAVGLVDDGPPPLRQHRGREHPPRPPPYR
ncbi:MAG: transporter permease [Marmoricola sp.]|nr:transporter permease [Marmoricola sp.]